jgi:hypothetical protein
MRIGLLVLVGIILFGVKMCSRSNPAPFMATAPPFSSESLLPVANPKPDFDRDVKPILQARCQPCHFQGGKVYDKLPFDRAETIKKLGTKLFTRIKDEKEQRVIREFLQ